MSLQPCCVPPHVPIASPHIPAVSPPVSTASCCPLMHPHHVPLCLCILLATPFLVTQQSCPHPCSRSGRRHPGQGKVNHKLVGNDPFSFFIHFPGACLILAGMPEGNQIGVWSPSAPCPREMSALKGRVRRYMMEMPRVGGLKLFLIQDKPSPSFHWGTSSLVLMSSTSHNTC